MDTATLHWPNLMPSDQRMMPAPYIIQALSGTTYVTLSARYCRSEARAAPYLTDHASMVIKPIRIESYEPASMPANNCILENVMSASIRIKLRTWDAMLREVLLETSGARRASKT